MESVTGLSICRTRQFGSLAADGWGENQKLPSHYSYFVEWLAASSSLGMRGHWEEAFIGLEIKDLDNPVEVGHLIRSHDACLVCTVASRKPEDE